jgi:glycosyltransferase involved in cell wall biosynthesis
LADQQPRVSFGVPVRNGADSIGRCLDSILAQDLDDFELIVSDNASTDATREIVERYAKRDARIRLLVQPQNVGLIENFNRVARAARGVYFRWVGADDWIEPRYASACAAALDLDPEAIAATSYFDLIHPDEHVECSEYKGEFLESRSALRRLERMLWFFRAGPTLYEPTYCLMRREVLTGTGLLRIHRKNDWLLSVRLALTGPFVHVPERLFHRRWAAVDAHYVDGLAKRLHPTRHAELGPSSLRLLRGMLGMIEEAPLTPAERRGARWLCIRFCIGEAGIDLRRRGRRLRRRIGITRARLGLHDPTP